MRPTRSNVQHDPTNLIGNLKNKQCVSNNKSFISFSKRKTWMAFMYKGNTLGTIYLYV